MNEPKLVRCERDGCVFTPHVRDIFDVQNEKLVVAKGIDCPRCGRRYKLQTDGTWKSDRLLTVLEVGTI